MKETEEQYKKELERITADPSERKRYLEFEDLFRKYEPHPDEKPPTVEERIYEVITSRCIEIHAGDELKSIPPLVFELNQLEEFSMYEHSLKEISADIKNLNNLKVLRINDNDLSSLPVEIAELKSLEELYIFNNPITKLVPRLFYNAKNLNTLCIHNLALKRIPKSIYYLQKLKELSISGYLIKEIDFDCFASLKNVAVYGSDLDMGPLNERYKDISFSYHHTPYSISYEDIAIREHIESIETGSPPSQWSDIQRDSYNKLLRNTGKALNYKLKENIEYSCDFFIYPDGSGRGEIKTTFYSCEKGLVNEKERLYLGNEDRGLLRLLKWLSLTFPSGRKVKVTAKKDARPEVTVCDSHDILKDILAWYAGVFFFKESDKIVFKLDFEDLDNPKKEGFVERAEEPEHTDLLTRAVERPSFDENFYFLYLTLEGAVRNMRIEITKRDIRVFADMDDMIDSLWDLTLDEFMLGY